MKELEIKFIELIKKEEELRKQMHIIDKAMEILR